MVQNDDDQKDISPQLNVLDMTLWSFKGAIFTLKLLALPPAAKAILIKLKLVTAVPINPSYRILALSASN